MVDDRRLQIDEVFHEVLACDQESRQARLADLCAGDSALESEVASLLEAFDRSGDFLEEPTGLTALDLEDEAVGPDRAGQTIGPWLVLRPLGLGGSGDVWLAERTLEGATQQAALKLIRTAVLAPEAIRRFRNECRVLAMLDHPGIARLIDGGITSGGQPYLAVEFVEGQTIDAWCSDRGLDTRGRIDLLMEVCAAVRHLHRHSVIHRDLKPGNILVGADGRAKLIDFGIARILDLAEDETELTMTGLERMTPSYASPEQLRGDWLTTASDVYSLGVVAYRLLTGRLPHEGQRRWDLEKEITSTPPARPSETTTVVRPSDLRGDLDTILLQALRPDPERRYPSINALREDLRRHLAGEPVVARGESWTYLADRFLRRHTIPAIAATVAVVALVGAAISGFTLYRQAEKARVEAEQTVAFLDGILAAADPTGVSPESGLTVHAALDLAAERIEDELAGSPLVAAQLHQTVGRAYVNLGLFDEGGGHLDQASGLYRDEGQGRSVAALATDLERAALLEKQGRLDEADSMLVALGDAGPMPTAELRANLALTLSRIRSNQAEWEGAMELAEEAAHQAEAMVVRGSPLPAQAENQIASVLYQLGRYEEAEAAFARVVEIARRDLGPNHVLTGEFLANRGVVLSELGRMEEAIAAMTEGQEIQAALLPPDHAELGVGYTNLANTQTQMGDAEGALENFRKARDIFAVSFGTDHNYWGFATNGMGVCCDRLGRYAEADTLFAAAIACMEGQLGEDHPQTALMKVNRARLLRKRGNLEESAELAQVALVSLETAFPEGSHLTSRALAALAEVDLDEGRARDAFDHASRGEALCADVPVGHRDRTTVTVLRIRSRAALGERAAAAAEFDTLLAALGAVADVDTVVLADIRTRRDELVRTP